MPPLRPRIHRERRSNVDRSATTRRQIFEATVKLLDSSGYGAVTNIRVADEAGVSRGAMMHHFPTRQDLLVATLEYAYDKVSIFRRSVLSKLPPGLPRYRALIELAWTTARMPESVASSEIRTGSRSDPEIRAAVAPMMSRLSDDYGRLVGRLVREAGLTPTPEIQGLTAITVLTMRSLAVNTFTYPREQLVRNALGALKAMRENIVASQLGRSKALSAEELEQPAVPGARAPKRARLASAALGAKPSRRLKARKAARKQSGEFGGRHRTRH
jgi:AcrR family transcriptional regulator